MRKMLEKDHQKWVIAWLKMAYPNLVYFHIPNEGLFPVQYRVQLKKMGVLAGVPDLFIAKSAELQSITYHGLFVEMKRDTKSKVTDKQNEVMHKLELQGYRCEVGYGRDDAMEKIKYYLRCVK